MFYSKKCGAIKSVKVEKHRKKKSAFAKANYALVEFAHKDSVEVHTLRNFSNVRKNRDAILKVQLYNLGTPIWHYFHTRWKKMKSYRIKILKFAAGC